MGESEPSSVSSEAVDDDQALLERLAKREERRQRRMKEALERQKELDPTIGTANGTDSRLEEQSSISSSTQRRKEDEEAKEEKAAPEEVTHTDTNSWRKEEEDKKEDVDVKMCFMFCLFVFYWFKIQILIFCSFTFVRNLLKNPNHQPQQTRYSFFTLCHFVGVCVTVHN